MIGLLEGIRVVETGVLLSVDNLGSLLGDAGADVIKVEAPGLGDYLRNIGPVLAPDCSVAHLASNRNKRSVTLDLRTQAGQAAMSRLIATADVFITGNIGDTNRKLGLDDEAVRADQGGYRLLPGDGVRFDGALRRHSNAWKDDGCAGRRHSSDGIA